jgi:3-oxoacyl-[acyl-carrier-protein] synthase-3
MSKDTVGIGAVGCYIPENTVSSDEIARQAGIPVQVLTEKIGMHKKPVAGSTEQPSDMVLAASRIALEKAHTKPDELDFIIYCGSAPQDYLLWSAGAKLQHSLGARNGFAFELTNGCNGLNLGMKVGWDMLLQNPSYRHALIASADKYSPFIDYTIQEDASLFHIADAAAAVVLRKGEPSNRIVSYHQMTDGSYSDYVKIKNGGAMYPYSRQEDHGKQTFSVENAKELSNILTEIYHKNYVASILSALEQSGHTVEDVDFLFTNQVKASTMAAVLDSLGVPPSKTFKSIEDYGHMGTVDTLFALSSSLEAGKISPGSLVVLASSAIGFSWAAMVLQF